MKPSEMMETNVNPMKLNNLQIAHELLAAGRPISFVKFITGITMAEMTRQKWVYEVMIPDPKGWEGGDPVTGEGATHNGHMLHTGNFRSVFPASQGTRVISNKQLKLKDRKAFFAVRRLRVS
jgi:hypothetical protein